MLHGTVPQEDISLAKTQLGVCFQSAIQMLHASACVVANTVTTQLLQLPSTDSINTGPQL